VAHKRGVIAAIGSLIADMQEADVAPAALAAASITPYDGELGPACAAYLAALQQMGRADLPRLMVLACQALQHDPTLLADVGLCVVDGFDHFSPLQLRFLAALSQSVGACVFTLTWSAKHRPAHRRFARTYEQLVAQFRPLVSPLSAIQTAQPEPAFAAPVLAHIEQVLFDLAPPPPIDAGGGLHLIEAADREREVRAALRRVRSLHETGSNLDAIALIFRSGAGYGTLLREVAAEYRVPLALADSLPLGDAPTVAALLLLLRLPMANYPRHDLVEVWRSIADGRLRIGSTWETPPSPAEMVQAAGLLERVGRWGGAAKGLARMRAAIEQAADVATEPPTDGESESKSESKSESESESKSESKSESESESESEEAPDREWVIAPADAVRLLTLFNGFVAWFNPPSNASVSDYVAWLLRTVAIPPTEHDTGDTRLAAARLLHALRDLAEATTELQEPPVSYGNFVAELSGVLATARYGRAAPRPGYVAALPVLAARGLRFDHVIMLGLNEGEFPQTLPRLPFYSRRERAALAQKGVSIPPPDPADERSLFYEVATRARHSLTLCRTYLDEQGNPIPPSPYLRAVLDLVKPESVSRVRVAAGSMPTLDEAVSPQETLVALLREQGSSDSPPVWPAGEKQVGREKQKSDGDRSRAPLPGFFPEQEQEHEQGNEQEHAPWCGYGWSLTIEPAALLAHALRAREVEHTREAASPPTGTAPYGPFEGVITDAALVEQVAAHFGADHLWSITQVNDYLTCPFLFLASQVLRLRARGDLALGLESVGRGLITHAILAEAGQAWTTQGHSWQPDHEQELLATLNHAADTVFNDAPQRFGFEPGEFWEWEQRDIRRRLVQAVRRGVANSREWGQFRPIEVERSFGLAKGSLPLKIETRAGPVLVAGRIDRIDEHDNGSLALLDYKSSATTRSLRETLDGHDVQLPVYLLAVEQRIRPGQRVERAGFFHLGSGKFSPALTGREREDALAMMANRVAETVEGSRSGQFAVRPRHTCPPYCAFQAICRLNLARRDMQK
jgi:superfamily I DNA/RNA helicase/RecB family exonuclease